MDYENYIEIVDGSVVMSIELFEELCQEIDKLRQMERIIGTDKVSMNDD